MHISFNGVIAVYTYNCPHAHRLRNIEHKYLERLDDNPEEADGTISKRAFGIEQHDLVSSYLKGEIESFEYLTDTIEWFKAIPDIKVEEQKFFGIDFTPRSSKPTSGDYISIRPDIITYTSHEVFLADWKFGNPEYGAAKYYDETDFFLALSISDYPYAYNFKSIIHFPQHDYTLPIRKYDYSQASKLQHKHMMRVEKIVNDKFFKPNPSKAHCKFCDQRSQEAGGTGECKYTAL